VQSTPDDVLSSGWGENSQWFKNIQQHPEVEIEVGGRRMRAVALRLSERQAEQELQDYARRHPTAYRTIGRLIFGEQAASNAEEFARLAKTIPILALRSRSTPSPNEKISAPGR
jgi:deazaflavin-dependent oxidoreductase (nitroreductase family)